MPITNFKISMNEYMRLVAEDAEKAEKRPIYGKLLTDLSKFAAMMQEYFSVNEDGKTKILDEDDYKKLIDGYTALAKDCNEFLSADHDKNRLESKRVNMITKLSTCVGQDLRGLLNADRTKKLTLSDVMRESRTRTVDLTGKNYSRVGGMLSNRIPLKGTLGTVGFFTKKSTFDYNSGREHIIKQLNQLLPEPFIGEFQKKDVAEDFLYGFQMIPKAEIDSDNLGIREAGYRSLTTLLRGLVPEMDKNSISDILKGNHDFAIKLQEIHKNFSAMEFQRDINQQAGISDNSRVDQRNSAMSDVAVLLGMSGIIAKATPMKIIRDGQVIEGTFMEKAVGEDIAHLSMDSLMLQSNEDSFNHPAGLKKLADLQILDYICGNIDRHNGNIMYQFGKDNDGKVILTGICGIDNDSSFGTKLFTDENGGKEIAPLPTIKNMSTSCFEAVSNLSLDALRLILKDKLKTEEIEAVCKRVELLQQKMQILEIDKGITKVPDEAWGKGDYTYDKLTTDSSRGVPSAISKALNEIKKINERVNELPEHTTDLTYSEGKDVTDQAEVKFQEIYSKLESFVTRAGNLRRKFHVNSEEYNNMLRSLKTALDSGKDIKTALENQEDVNLDRFKDFARTVVELGISSQEYMSAKNLFQHTELGKDRFALATDMRNLAQENFAIKEAAPEVKKPEAVKEPEPRMML